MLGHGLGERGAGAEARSQEQPAACTPEEFAVRLPARLIKSLLLSIVGTCIAAQAAASTITTFPIDPGTTTAQRSSIAVGLDGLPVVTYVTGARGEELSSLRVTRCGTADCSSGNVSTDVAIGYILTNFSVAVPEDGRPVLAFIQVIAGTPRVRYLRCGNATCTSGNTTVTLPGTPSAPLVPPYDRAIGEGPVLDRDGLPVVAFSQPGSVRVVTCNDVGCANHVLADIPVASGYSAKLAIGTENNPVVATHSNGTMVAVCNARGCPEVPSFVKVSEEGGYDFSLSTYFGNPAVAIRTSPESLQGIRVLVCVYSDCSQGAFHSNTISVQGESVSLVKAPRGPDFLTEVFAAVAEGGLVVAYCPKYSGCATDTNLRVVEERPIDDGIAIALDDDWHVVLAYAINGRMHVARCGDRTLYAGCQGPTSVRAPGQSGDPLAFVTPVGTNRVALLDPASGFYVSDISVPPGPLGVAFSRDGKKAYVTSFHAGGVSFIDIRTRTNLEYPNFGADSQPRGIAVAADGARLYVALSAKNELVVVDVATGESIVHIPVGAGPSGVAITPDGQTVLVANTDGHSLSFVSATANALLATIPVGQVPFGVAISPDSKTAYVAVYGSNAVSVVDIPSRSVVATVPVGQGPYGLALKSDGTRLYVSDNQNRVSVVDTASRTIIASIPVGSHPQGIALTPDDAELYVSNQYGNSVDVIDTQYNLVFHTIPVAGSPISFGAFVSPPLIDAEQAVEYFHAGMGHYFVTSIPAEIQALDNATIPGWARTNETFQVFDINAGHTYVCRYFSAAFAPKSSHFYSPLAHECEILRTNPLWTREGFVFNVRLVSGSCPFGTTALFRLYNNGQGGAPNHRYTTKTSIRDQMVTAGFVFEGATGCVPK
jgi:YVTN family beta-propeller protein